MKYYSGLHARNFEININEDNMKKILIAYFSHSGNTREIASQIQKITGGGVFEIQTVKPYPDDYDAVVERAKRELESGYTPVLKTKVENPDLYDVIFIGYPSWWSTIPAPVKAFLSECDFSGKDIVPFCTHEGSAMGRSVADILKLCPKVKVLEGLAVRGSTVKTAQKKVSEWLSKIGIIK
jgi:flavodoxin